MPHTIVDGPVEFIGRMSREEGLCSAAELVDRAEDFCG